MDGLIQIYDTERYSESRYFTIQDTNYDTRVSSVRLLHESKTHPVMEVVKTGWAITDLYSGQSLVGLGAMIITRTELNNYNLR